MTKSYVKQAFWLAVLTTGLVLSLTTGFLDSIVFPIAIGAFALLSFGAGFAALVYFRKYREDHPFIPYAGQWAHVLCRECERVGRNYTISMTTGTAIEEWRDGLYRRRFKRLYRASCSHGHAWTYDPILERNELDLNPRKPRVYNLGSVIPKALRDMLLMRRQREMLHGIYTGDLR
jgi:hypothetical protein